MLSGTGEEVDAPTAGRTDNVIDVRGLCKSYGGTRALENVSFTVGGGEVFGYLGPNGAGKTTTINILCGLLTCDAGELRIHGLDINEESIAVKQRIGVVPEESNLYPELTCWRNLEYVGELYGLSRAVRRKRVNDLLETFDLCDKKTAPFRALSRGMKRRLTVAAALVHSPEIVFLDEPTAGLDVPSARTLRSVVRAMNRDGTTVFLTTHNLAEAEALCSRVLVLVKGQVAAQGTVAEIRHQVDRARVLCVTLSDDVPEVSLRDACPSVRSISRVNGAWRLEVVDTHTAVGQLLSFAEDQGLRVLEIGSEIASFEEVFMTILKDNGEKAQESP